MVVEERTREHEDMRTWGASGWVGVSRKARVVLVLVRVIWGGLEGEGLTCWGGLCLVSGWWFASTCRDELDLVGG